MDWSWILLGVILVIVAVVVFLFVRSTRRWQIPPPDLGTTEGRTLFWIRWSRGDKG
jgi:hypothetical protein